MAYRNNKGKSKRVIVLLSAIVALIVALFAYSEVLDGTLDSVCPSGTFYMSAATTAGLVCCSTDNLGPTSTLCDETNESSSVDSMFGDSAFLFINNIVPLFGIIGVFGLLYLLLKTLKT